MAQRIRTQPTCPSTQGSSLRWRLQSALRRRVARSGRVVVPHDTDRGDLDSEDFGDGDQELLFNTPSRYALVTTPLTRAHGHPPGDLTLGWAPGVNTSQSVRTLGPRDRGCRHRCPTASTLYTSPHRLVCLCHRPPILTIVSRPSLLLNTLFSFAALLLPPPGTSTFSSSALLGLQRTVTCRNSRSLKFEK
ncbi:hypothetical protein B0H14DRAFT_2640914 [Mycena olivaceomarginata]|nr:hypothetical protein B0H14DRAFT_2640914 [Mycena olivaceomarginata]